MITAGGIAIGDTIRSIETWFNVLERRAPAPRRTVGDRPSVTKAFAGAGLQDIKLVEPAYK